MKGLPGRVQIYRPEDVPKGRGDPGGRPIQGRDKPCPYAAGLPAQIWLAMAGPHAVGTAEL